MRCSVRSCAGLPTPTMTDAPADRPLDTAPGGLAVRPGLVQIVPPPGASRPTAIVDAGRDNVPLRVCASAAPGVEAVATPSTW